MRWHAVVGVLLVVLSLGIYFFLPATQLLNMTTGEQITLTLSTVMRACVYYYQQTPGPSFFASPLFEGDCALVTPISFALYALTFVGCLLIAWSAFRHLLRPKRAISKKQA